MRSCLRRAVDTAAVDVAAAGAGAEAVVVVAVADEENDDGEERNAAAAVVSGGAAGVEMAAGAARATADKEEKLPHLLDSAHRKLACAAQRNGRSPWPP